METEALARAGQSAQRIGQINALLCPAPPFDKPATSASELRAARQGEDAGHKAPGLLHRCIRSRTDPPVARASWLQ